MKNLKDRYNIAELLVSENLKALAGELLDWKGGKSFPENSKFLEVENSLAFIGRNRRTVLERMIFDKVLSDYVNSKTEKWINPIKAVEYKNGESVD